MIKIVTGFILALTLVFGMGEHAQSMRDRLEYNVCVYYGLCYGYEWVNCDKNGHNCDMDQMWVIYTNEGQIPLRFLGVKRIR
jgi:hypothetical protein